jgi:hypothetical protein
LLEIAKLNEAVDFNVKVCPQFEKLNLGVLVSFTLFWSCRFTDSLVNPEYYQLLGQVLEKESNNYVYKIEHFNKISQNKTVIGRYARFYLHLIFLSF